MPRSYSRRSPATQAKMKEDKKKLKSAVKKALTSPGKAVVMVVKKMKRK